MSDGQWIERATLENWADRDTEQMTRIRELEAEIAALKAERDKLSEALRFYACRETWEQSPKSSDELSCTEADFDQGHIAIQTLDELAETEGRGDE